MVTDRLRFGQFEADLKTGELRRDGIPVPVQDLPFRLLAALLERPGELLTRAELTERLWGTDTFVDATAGLNTAIAKLREALDDDAERPVYVETVPKRGYRFTGRLEPTSEAAQDVSPAAPDARLTPRRSTWLGATLSVSKGRAPGATRLTAWAAVAVLVLVAYQLRADRSQTRVAVVLFDNETGRPELGRLAQGLTDATVFELTAQPRLTVIGNAAVLRTPRPFRDIAAIRDALQADFIVIGQVQTVDAQVLVRAHLIRAKDQAHVWVDVVRMTSTETALQSDVAHRISTAVAARSPAAR